MSFNSHVRVIKNKLASCKKVKNEESFGLRSAGSWSLAVMLKMFGFVKPETMVQRILLEYLFFFILIGNGFSFVWPMAYWCIVYMPYLLNGVIKEKFPTLLECTDCPAFQLGKNFSSCNLINKILDKIWLNCQDEMQESLLRMTYNVFFPNQPHPKKMDINLGPKFPFKLTGVRVTNTKSEAEVVFGFHVEISDKNLIHFYPTAHSYFGLRQVTFSAQASMKIGPLKPQPKDDVHWFCNLQFLTEPHLDFKWCGLLGFLSLPGIQTFSNLFFRKCLPHSVKIVKNKFDRDFLEEPVGIVTITIHNAVNLKRKICKPRISQAAVIFENRLLVSDYSTETLKPEWNFVCKFALSQSDLDRAISIAIIDTIKPEEKQVRGETELRISHLKEKKKFEGICELLGQENPRVKFSSHYRKIVPENPKAPEGVLTLRIPDLPFSACDQYILEFGIAGSGEPFRKVFGQSRSETSQSQTFQIPFSDRRTDILEVKLIRLMEDFKPRTIFSKIRRMTQPVSWVVDLMVKKINAKNDFLLVNTNCIKNGEQVMTSETFILTKMKDEKISIDMGPTPDDKFFEVEMFYRFHSVGN